MDYILQGKLSIAGVLFRFVNNELLPDTGIDPKKFWEGLDKYAHELAPKNAKLLEFRESLQKKIDVWHRDRKGEKINVKDYSNFLKKIGYLKKKKKNLKLKLKMSIVKFLKLLGHNL